MGQIGASLDSVFLKVRHWACLFEAITLFAPVFGASLDWVFLKVRHWA